MSEENVEVVREGYAAYNAATDAPNSREAIRAVWERIADPEIEWEQVFLASAAGTQTFHGIDGVMEFFDQILDTFDYARQIPERFIDCGDQVLVFVRTEARAHAIGLELNEEWAHLITMRDGKIVRVQQFRDRDQALEAAGLSE
jgi:uncharacterized protein